MFKELRPEAKDLLERVSKFLLDEVAPNEQKFEQQIRKDQDRWNYYPEIVEEIKEKGLSHKDCGIYFYQKVNLVLV